MNLPTLNRINIELDPIIVQDRLREEMLSQRTKGKKIKLIIKPNNFDFLIYF
jgi:hypothetical protein